MARLVILTGRVHTGKTTALQTLVARHPNRFAGVLAPVINQQRYLRDISTGEQRCLERPLGPEDKLPVGPYTFSRAVFHWARQRLTEHAAMYPDRWLIIDEVGKLELRGQGLAPLAVEIAKNDHTSKVLIVVRDSLVDQAIHRLDKKQYLVVRKEDLKTIIR